MYLNLAYRWLCRLDLEDSIPGHAAFSKNRHGRIRLSDAFRLVFDAVLRRCMPNARYALPSRREFPVLAGRFRLIADTLLRELNYHSD